MSFAGKYLKPYQGLKLAAKYSPQRQTRRKIPKTLSGIETQWEKGFPEFTENRAGKYLKPYQGLKPDR